MNITTLISAVLSLLLSVNIMAQNRETIVYSNSDEKSNLKEYTILDKNSSEVLSKISFQFDKKGLPTYKTSYTWNSDKGWILSKKYEYLYNDNNQLTDIVFTRWDHDTNQWAGISERITHVYNSNGTLLYTQQILIDNNKNTLLSYK
jgi:hypothetical protein